MRKTVLALSVAAAAAISTAASAQPVNYPSTAYVPVTAGIVAGTVVGIGAAEGWWGPGPASLGTVGGAAALGLVVGIGTVVAVHSVTTPCTGFRILVDSPAECARTSGYVAAAAPVAERRVERRRYR